MGEILRGQNDLDGALSATNGFVLQPNSAEAQAAIGDILLTGTLYLQLLPIIG